MPSLRIPSLLATVVRGSQEMVLFYRGPEARITDTVFESLSPIHQVYPINELQSVHTPRQDVIEQVTSSGPVRVCSTGMAGLSVLVATAGWPILDQPPVTMAALVLLGVSSSLSAASWRIRMRPRELRAIYRGHLVCLYRSPNRRTFGQVTRALLRVLEQLDDMR
jgi:hypothetical protein